ncbi:MAG: hypothetical protein HW391_516 [Chloroflexi bacterium]|nr:hypothetical protein [Chloroflexota bacterium]
MRRFLPLIPASFLLLVLLAFVPAALAGGGCHDGGTKPGVGTAPTVKIDGCTFGPAINRVEVGTVVTWMNTSVTPHDVTGAQGAWGSRVLEVGGSFSQAFPVAGLYPYSCSLHPGMAGVIEVVAKGSAAVAGAAASAAPAPAADQSSATDSTPDGAGDLVPVAAGGLGIVLGALGAALFVRRRGTEATTAQA